MLLAPYRILDVTDEKGLFCGRLLADLGAEVILVEPPSGHPARLSVPFWQDASHPERSLSWWALSSNKRSLTLNIETPQGRGLFLRLAEKADFILESFPPGHLEGLGLGYPRLASRNPGLILVSLSPFGQTGPYRDYRTSDLVAMSLGGVVYATGDPDRPPLRISAEQAYLMAGLHGAASALIALFSRFLTGQGQWLDVSIHECLLVTVCPDVMVWDMGKIMPRRCGSTVMRGGYQARAIWPCQDGLIAFRVGGGSFGEGVRSLVDWMDSEGQAGSLKRFTWEPAEVKDLSPQERQEQDEAFSHFFLQHTKVEVFQEAMKRGFYAQPANSITDIMADPQLQSRGFWQRLEPEAGHSFLFPGLPLGPGVPLAPRRPAPRLGEANAQVYGEEMGFSPQEMARLRQEGVL